MSDQVPAKRVAPAPAANGSAHRHLDSEPVVPKVMSAVAYHEYGDPEVLEPILAATPKPGADQALIRVRAASVNPIDYRMRKGELRWVLPGGFPRIPGYDIAGEVVSCAAHASVSVGDRVFAFLDNPYGGGYAEYAACTLSCLAKMPEGMSYEQAAAIPLAASTALQSLRDHGSIQPGNRVLINGASGGVGAFAIQIAKSFDTHVTAVASGKHEDYVHSLGADEFIDRLRTDFTKSHERWDLIFDAAGKSSFLAASQVLNPGGHYVSTEPSVWGAILSAASVILPKHARVMLARPRATDLRDLAMRFSQRQLLVEINEVLPLDEAAKAHRQLEQGIGRGKLVLQIRS
ncbi:MAG: NAD(P)-dependent alcohol dehydrogenase [Planctomycetaceae bacterium]